MAGVKRPEQCILMYGPSGTGKTFSAKMLAKELGAEYAEVQFADVSSPYIGQTSVEIQNVFKQLKKQAEIKWLLDDDTRSIRDFRIIFGKNFL